MSNLCSDCTLHGCPASFYLACRAYEKGINCWEASEKPCCPNKDIAVCRACKVYMNCRTGI